MPHLVRLPGSCIISDGRIIKKARKPRPTKRVLITPQTPRKASCSQRVVAVVIKHGVAGVRIRQDISPPPSPHKPER